MQEVDAAIGEEEHTTTRLNYGLSGRTTDVGSQSFDIGIVAEGIACDIAVRADIHIEDAVTHKHQELIKSPRGDSDHLVVASVVYGESVKGIPVVEVQEVRDRDCIKVSKGIGF